jgi:hypothetical protein
MDEISTLDADSSTEAIMSVKLLHPTSKCIKLFNFIAAQTRITVGTSHMSFTAADGDKQYALFTSDTDNTGGLGIFNDKCFRALRSLARKVLTVTLHYINAFNIAPITVKNEHRR